MKRVFVHGLGQTPDSWRETLSRLNAGEETVCPGLAGLLEGREASYENLYGAFAELCAGMGGPVDLCGLSLGSVLSLNYAADYPERVRSLALIAPQYQMPKGLLRLQNALFRLMPQAMFRRAGFEKDEFIRLCGSMMELDLSGGLQRVDCPALIICGERDRANKKAAAELAGILKNAGPREIEEAGHEVNLDAPAALAEALRDFYSRLPAEGKS